MGCVENDAETVCVAVLTSAGLVLPWLLVMVVVIFHYCRQEPGDISFVLAPTMNLRIPSDNH